MFVLKARVRVSNHGMPWVDIVVVKNKAIEAGE